MGVEPGELVEPLLDGPAEGPVVQVQVVQHVAHLGGEHVVQGPVLNPFLPTGQFMAPKINYLN